MSLDKNWGEFRQKKGGEFRQLDRVKTKTGVSLDKKWGEFKQRPG